MGSAAKGVEREMKKKKHGAWYSVWRAPSSRATNLFPLQSLDGQSDGGCIPSPAMESVSTQNLGPVTGTGSKHAPKTLH